MKIVPFSTHTVDLRVIDSRIGKVVPIVDIAKAIEYVPQKLTDMIERNIELFEGSLVPITVTSHFDQKLKDGTIQQRSQEFEVKALNSYGVYGLLMKLDYNRIQDEGKKQAVIRFQKWAMETLAQADKFNVRPAKRVTGNRTRGRYIDSDPIAPEGMKVIHYKQVCEMIGKSRRTLQRFVRDGFLVRYRGSMYNYEEVKKIAERRQTGKEL